MARQLTRKLTFAGLGVAGAGGLLGLALIGPTNAFADPSPSPSASASANPKADRGAARAAQENARAEALAKELGIDAAKVKAALEKVDAQMAAEAKAKRLTALKTRLDAAVAEGKLTREQADAILKAAEAGVLPGADGHGKGPLR